MAYYQAGRLTSMGTPQQQGHAPPGGQNQGHSLHRIPSFDAGDDSRTQDAAAAGIPQSQYSTVPPPAPAPQGHHNSIAGSAYIGAGSPQFQPGPQSPGQSSYQSYSPRFVQTAFQQTTPPIPQQAYNPQNYAQVSPQPSQPAQSPGINRAFSTAAVQTYNPAAYHGDNITRHSSTRDHYYAPPISSFHSTTVHAAPPQLPYPPPSLTGRQERFASVPNNAVPPEAIDPAAFPYLSQVARANTIPHPEASYTTSAPRPAPPPLPVPPSSDSYFGDGWRNPSPTPVVNGPRQQPSGARIAPASLRPTAQPPSTHNAQLPPSQPLYPNEPTYDRQPLAVHSSDQHIPLPLVPTPYSPRMVDPAGRHPQARPLPGPPPELEAESPGDASMNAHSRQKTNWSQEEWVQDDLYTEVENALQGNATGRPQAGNPCYPSSNSNSSQHPTYVANPYVVSGATSVNGDRSPADEIGGGNDSDLEAIAGLEALNLAEEQDKIDEERRRSGLRTTFPGYPPPSRTGTTLDRQGTGSGSDYGNIDMDAYSGGFQGVISYGPSSSTNHAITNAAASSGINGRNSHVPSLAANATHSFPTSSPARVDTSGTGGLADPNSVNRRLSFDEGDEADMPDMFYHPGITSRPLPQPPIAVAAPGRPYRPNDHSTRLDVNRLSYPIAPESYEGLSGPGSQVPRATSLVSHSPNSAALVALNRSKTDVEERKLRQQRSALANGSDTVQEDPSARTPGGVSLDLPSLPVGKRFNPSKLTASDFKRCAEPWALSSIVSWLRMMAEGEQDLREQSIVDGLVALLTHKLPTLNIADAEALGARIVDDMCKAGTLVREEEWLKFAEGSVSGVLFQLTGAGCYASKLHDQQMTGRCYSHHCQRTLKKIDLQTQPTQSRSQDWATFYKLTKEDMEKASKSDIDRQMVLHEIVLTEDGYMDQLNVLRVVYQDAIAAAQPPIIAPKRLAGFLRDVFGKFDAIKKASEDYLLPQLKYRQQEQGPFIVGFSDIFRQWIRRAKQAYIDHAAEFPHANFLVRQEDERNVLFRTFLEQARTHQLSGRLGWDTYLKAPIARLQRYGLLLSVVHGKTEDGEEKHNLDVAIQEIKAVTMECDSIVAEMGRKVDLADLQSKLIQRPDMPRVDLNLDHLGRQLIYKGDLWRIGASNFTWLETHLLLFDHYLVLAKSIKHKDPTGGMKLARYDVSRLPIPMDLLILESSNDDPVVKGRGIAAVTGVSRPAPGTETRLTKGSGSAAPSPGNVNHSMTSASIASTSIPSNTAMVTSTVLEPGNENNLYPFKIKHLGKDVYTLYASSAQNRRDWCDKIVEAKTKHAASLFSQNAEPFRLRVMADSAFAYDGATAGQSSIVIKGTPLDRAIRDVERKFENAGRPGPVCRSRVNCATTFVLPHGRQMVAIGTDFGVFTSGLEDSRGWSRAIAVPKVTQIAVLEEFGLFLLISDKALIAYHLDLVCPINGTPVANDSDRRAPQKLSRNRDVGFFMTGKMKDRVLVFYKKRDGISSTFKVLEPVFQKSSEKKSRFLRSGRTESFREYDEFYIPAECIGINLFHSYISISTAKGFEVLTLDKKQAVSVPDLTQPGVTKIASRLAEQKPLGMFRLSDQEFLLCYNECAVYVNKHGDISRSVVMNFVGRAHAAALYGRYVLLFDADFVEIRNALDGRLRQIIGGRDVKCLDDGLGGCNPNGRTVKISMQHPEHERSQIVLELLLNEGSFG